MEEDPFPIRDLLLPGYQSTIDILDAKDSEDRTKDLLFHAFCGTGKSRVEYHLAVRPELTLIVFPLLALISQFIDASGLDDQEPLIVSCQRAKGATT